MDETTKLILNYLLGLLSCGALFTFIQFLIQRHDKKKDDLKEVKEIVTAARNEIKETRSEVASVKDDVSEFKATLARTHILRFADELHDGRYHSDESFRQQIEDIDTYNKYCLKHTDFKNGLTVMASEYIIKEYHKRFLSNDEPA